MVVVWLEAVKLVEDGLAIIFVIFWCCLTLFLVLFPKKNLGILNLLVGLVGLVVASGSFLLSDFPFAPYSCIAVGVLSVLCIAVGDRVLL